MTLVAIGLKRWRLPVAAAISLLAFEVGAQDANALRDRHTELRSALADNVFQRPLVLESKQSSGRLQGDVYAQIEQPYAAVAASLTDGPQWCDILILHLNVKRCVTDGPEALTLNLGRKFDQPLEDAQRIDFRYRVANAGPDYLQVRLNADKGPLSTSDFSIVVEAVALNSKRSFLHLSYAFEHGLMARMAMNTYLATVGRNKVGFSVVGVTDDQKPMYIGGMRGVIERNTMRYYLAIAAYLDAQTAPASVRVDTRLGNWYAGVERYPLQLHELTRAEYLTMKRKEIRRQQTPAAFAAAN